MKFSTRQLLLVFPWIACALMAARMAWVESQRPPAPRFTDNYSEPGGTAYAIHKGTGLPVYIHQRRWESLGYQGGWSYDIEFPDESRETVYEAQLDPSDDPTEYALFNRFHAIADAAAAKEQAEFDAKWPDGRVSVRENGEMEVRGVFADYDAPGRNLIQHRTELETIDWAGRKLFDFWAINWEEYGTGRYVPVCNPQDNVVWCVEHPRNPSRKNNSLVAIGGFNSSLKDNVIDGTGLPPGMTAISISSETPGKITFSGCGIFARNATTTATPQPESEASDDE